MRCWRTKTLLLALCAALLPPAAPATGAVPAFMSFQGRLLQSDGSPEAGILSVGFALYAEEMGGSPLWSETQTIAFAEGFYSVMLGTVSPLPVSVLDDPLWISVTIAGTELLPRMQVASVAFALRAAVAEQLSAVATGPGSGLDTDTLDGLDSTDFALDSHAHAPGDANTLDGVDSTGFALDSHTHAPGDANTLDGIDSSGFALDSHTHAPGDADTLDGVDSTGFAGSGHGHAGIPTYYEATQTVQTAVNGSTWTAIPGTDVTITVPAGGADVDMFAYGAVVAIDNGGSAYTHCGFRFVVDGAGRGNVTWGDQIVGVADTSGVTGPWWQSWTIRRLENMSAGAHTVAVEMIGWGSSPDDCRQDTQDYSKARLYVTLR